VPTFWLGKVRLLGDNPTAVPTPVKRITSDPPELSLILIADLRGPEAVGEKVALTWQLAPAARVLGEIGQLLFWLKSLLLAPAIPMAVIVRAWPALFVSVTGWPALAVPRSSVPKYNDGGLDETDELASRAGTRAARKAATNITSSALENKP
jgi:hypothetical protein